MRKTLSSLFAVIALSLAPFATPAFGQNPADEENAKTTLGLLDYLAADYGGAVSNGEISNPAEFAEMSEFAIAIEDRLGALTDTPGRQGLLDEADDLRRAIEGKASAEKIQTQARRLAGVVAALYPVALSPARAPDLALGAALYREHCGSCHGAAGAGDGPLATSLNPRPVAFADKSRADQRTLFGLYQVIDQGVSDTGMRAFSEFSADEKWALAFYAGGLSFDQSDIDNGRRLWKKSKEAKQRLPSFTVLTQVSIAQLEAEGSLPDARAIIAYLRADPAALEPPGGEPLAIARQKIAAAITAYKDGDAAEAARLALSAYLDGVEPIEPALSARDTALLRHLEDAMSRFRSLIKSGASQEALAQQAAAVNTLLDNAGDLLSRSKANAAAAFAGAFTILLREGVEALLIIVMILAFLRKAGQDQATRMVHGGWVTALAAGALTWWAATSLITISGASRELTEGVGGLAAAFVLVSVGVWMHGKSRAGAWNEYVRAQVTRALSRRSAWFLFILSFIVVYREIFETILFFAALWSEGGRAAMLAGAGAGALVLAAIAWAFFRYSQRLPIARFFAWSAILIAILAIILAGKGVAALQEAGVIGAHYIPVVPRIDALGLYPTLQSFGAQLLAALVLAAGFFTPWRRKSTV